MSVQSPERLIVDLAPNQELLVRATAYNPNRSPDLFEELRGVATNLWESARNARSGSINDKDALDASLVPHTKFIERLLAANVPGDVVYEEIFKAYQSDPGRNIDARTAKEMAGIASTAFGFPPEEPSQSK